MSNIRDEIFERKAMQEMETNAEIESSSLQLKYKLYIDGKYSSGGLRANGKSYTRRSVYWDISLKTANDFISKSEEEEKEWVNDNIRKYEKQFGLYKSVNTQVILNPIIYYEINYFNGSQVIGMKDFLIENSNYSATLLENNSNKLKIVSESDIINICCNNTEVNLKSTQKNNHTQSQLETLVKSYLSEDNKWCKGKFEVKENENELELKIIHKNSEFGISFTPPFNESNKIWDLMDEFNCSDPKNLNNRACEFAPEAIGEIGVNLDHINIKNPKTKQGNISKIKNLFSFSKWC